MHFIRYARGALWAPRAFWYDSDMKLMLSSLLLWVVALPLFAYELVHTATLPPYEPMPITVDEYNKQVFLGELNRYPIMYEFSIDRTTELSLQLSTVIGVTEKPAFALLVVRDNDDGGGVTEIARLPATESEWSRRKDSAYGLSFTEGSVLQHTYEPGRYRVEVSTPANEGAYMLTVGAESDPLGYFKTLGHVYIVQRHFGYSIFTMLRSSYVYYPLGIIFLLWAIRRTWKLRNTISNAP